jgi:hypothetical protein
MSGAGAGAFGLLLAALVFASPIACLIAALMTWILVLPKWTFAASALFLASCGLQLILWNAEPDAVMGRIAASGSFALTVGALLMIAAALVFRIGAMIFAVARGRQRCRLHPETCE